MRIGYLHTQPFPGHCLHDSSTTLTSTAPGFIWSRMVCPTCEKKLRTVACPDKWKEGSANTVESGGRKLNENKLLNKTKKCAWSTPPANANPALCCWRVQLSARHLLHLQHGPAALHCCRYAPYARGTAAKCLVCKSGLHQVCLLLSVDVYSIRCVYILCLCV